MPNSSARRRRWRDVSGAATAWLSGAAVTAGNQPFAIGTPGKTSLRIPAGTSAVSAPMCIDSTFPHFRMFARNLGALKSTLKAEVLFLNNKGEIKATASGQILAAGTAWFPSDSLRIGVVFDTALAGGAAPVAFRFVAGKDAAGRSTTSSSTRTCAGRSAAPGAPVACVMAYAAHLPAHADSDRAPSWRRSP